jgi:hypothetical protein
MAANEQILMVADTAASRHEMQKNVMIWSGFSSSTE